MRRHGDGAMGRLPEASSHKALFSLRSLRSLRETDGSPFSLCVLCAKQTEEEKSWKSEE